MIFFEFAPVKTSSRHAYKLYKPRCSNARANFSYRVVEVWTSLPDWVSFESLSAFKRTISAVDFSGFIKMCVGLVYFSFTGGCEFFLLRALLFGSHCVMSRYVSCCISWVNKDVCMYVCMYNHPIRQCSNNDEEKTPILEQRTSLCCCTCDCSF